VINLAVRKHSADLLKDLGLEKYPAMVKVTVAGAQAVVLDESGEGDEDSGHWDAGTAKW
jgi:hypothetical protein